MSKDLLRKLYLDQRKRLNLSTVSDKSRIICNKVLRLADLSGKKNFALYLPINNEVDTQILVDKLSKQGLFLFVPCSYNNSDYFFCRYTDNLESGPFGIKQSKDQMRVDSSVIDVAIVPGVAFDKKGYRLGYGKGVYDKLLANSDTVKIGLAYEFQMVDQLPHEKHDLRMDIVITQERLYRIKVYS